MIDLKFLLRVLMLEDIMAAAMALSLQFQTVNVLAWEQQKRTKETYAHFVAMVQLLTGCARMSNAAAMWAAILKSGLFPFTTMKECTKPNRKAASTDPMVVLNAKTIFENGTYGGVKLIVVKAPSFRSKLARKAKAQEGTASASSDVPVLMDHVLALQGLLVTSAILPRALNSTSLSECSATTTWLLPLLQTTWTEHGTKKPRHGSTSERWAAALICLP
jgi:hypothetical protein